MATVWRCNWCGRKQPADTLSQALQGEYVATYFGWQVSFPIHNCCPEHDARTRGYLTFTQQWMWPFATALVVALVVITVGSVARYVWLSSLGLMGLGALVLFLPLARNTLKMNPDTHHRFVRWVGDLLMPNASPGDLLLSWRSCIATVRVLGALIVVVGLLNLLGLLQ